MALKWGTDSKVRFLEPELGLPLDIGACGELNLAVSDGKKLVTKLVGTSAAAASPRMAEAQTRCELTWRGGGGGRRHAAARRRPRCMPRGTLRLTKQRAKACRCRRAYAEGIGHMGGGSGGSGVVGDMLGLGVGMAAMGTVAPQLADAVRGLAGGAAGQPVRCPACGKELPAGAKFCLECGARVAPAAREVVCPACGRRTPPGKFCTECGAQL